MGEPRKDYIHVRERRGEAKDSHSLAQRANTLAYITNYLVHYRRSRLSPLTLHLMQARRENQQAQENFTVPCSRLPLQI